MLAAFQYSSLHGTNSNPTLQFSTMALPSREDSICGSIQFDDLYEPQKTNAGLPSCSPRNLVDNQLILSETSSIFYQCEEDDPMPTGPDWLSEHMAHADSFFGAGVDPRDVNSIMSETSFTSNAGHGYSNSESSTSIYSERGYSPQDGLASSYQIYPYGTLSAISQDYHTAEGHAVDSSIIGADIPSSNDGKMEVDNELPQVNGKDLPYNKLLYRCLREAPNHEMSLQDIYTWFRNHTNKGSMPHEKGWQNSIRHNLSMNQAFKRGPRSNDTTAKNVWCLQDEAISQGIEPTTRYRKHVFNRRQCASDRRIGRISKYALDGRLTASSAPATPLASLRHMPTEDRSSTPASVLSNPSDLKHIEAPYYNSGNMLSSPQIDGSVASIDGQDPRLDQQDDTVSYRSNISWPNSYAPALNSTRGFPHPSLEVNYDFPFQQQRNHEVSMTTPASCPSAQQHVHQYADPTLRFDDYHCSGMSLDIPRSDPFLFSMIASRPLQNVQDSSLQQQQSQGERGIVQSQCNFSHPDSVAQASPGGELFYGTEEGREKDKMYKKPEGAYDNNVDISLLNESNNNAGNCFVTTDRSTGHF